MAIAAVVTRGYGSFGSIPEVVTRGYISGEPVVPPEPQINFAAAPTRIPKAHRASGQIVSDSAEIHGVALVTRTGEDYHAFILLSV